MYALAGLIVEKYANQSLPSYVKEHIFDPLGMTSTSYDAVSAEAAGSLSQSFTTFNGTTRRIPLWMDDNAQRVIGAAGGVVSNIVDMV